MHIILPLRFGITWYLNENRSRFVSTSSLNSSRSYNFSWPYTKPWSIAWGDVRCNSAVIIEGSIILTHWFPFIRPYQTLILLGGFVRGGVGWPTIIICDYGRWWLFQRFFWTFSPRKFGKIPIWRAYFSNGLVQPPTSYNWRIHHMNRSRSGNCPGLPKELRAKQRERAVCRSILRFVQTKIGWFRF